MLNHIVLMGRLTKDPELRYTQNGVARASFSLAVDRDYKDPSGERKTDFIEIAAWRNIAEYAAKYFSKGRMAVVHGSLQVRDYTDQNGNKRRIAEVLAESMYFADSRKSEEKPAAYTPAASMPNEYPPFNDMDDDLPY